MPISFGEEADLSLTIIGDGLADAQTKTCSLHKVIQLHKPFKHLCLVFLGNTGTGILTIEVKPVLAGPLLKLITYLDMALLRILR